MKLRRVTTIATDRPTALARSFAIAVCGAQNRSNARATDNNRQEGLGETISASFRDPADTTRFPQGISWDRSYVS